MENLKGFIRLALVVALAGPFAIAGPLAAPAQAAATLPYLTKIRYDAPGADTATNANGERVAVYNPTSKPYPMKGWKIADKANNGYKFPASYKIPAQSTVVIYTGKGTNGAKKLYWGRGAHVWGNSGDTAYLIHLPTATTYDTCKYSDTWANNTATC